MLFIAGKLDEKTDTAPVASDVRTEVKTGRN